MSKSFFASLVAAGLGLAAGLAAAPPLTVIQDMLYKADGTRFNGTAAVSWKSFEASDGSAITMHSLMVKIVDGQLRVQLVPNAGVSPASYYAVKYSSDGRIQFEEAWLVPASAIPVRLRDVRVTPVAAAAADTAPVQVAEVEVTGLLSDLNARPMRGPGFAPGRAAVISPAGTVESAVGEPADCLRVDGSAGPCGAGDPGFVDNESPAGAVDGSNVTFTLSATPMPGQSLAMYRNGMLQKAGQDYTMAGRGITFVAGATPQPGDTLLASYRSPGASSGVAAAAAPEVLCSGAGQATTATESTSLGACAIAAGKLAAGDRVEALFNYAHTGSQSGFRFDVQWGGADAAARTAAAGETLVAGRSEAAVAADGVQIGSQTWGATLPMASGAVSVAGDPAAAVAIDFRGNLTAAGDVLKLTSYTVVRYPAQ